MQLSHQGERFGHRVWCSIVVDPPMLLEPPQAGAEQQSLLQVANTQQSVVVSVRCQNWKSVECYSARKKN